MPITKEDLENAKQDADKRKAEKEQAKIKAEEKESNEAPRKAASDAVKYVKEKFGFKKGGDVKVKKMALGGMGSRPAPTPPPAASRMAPPMPAPAMPAGKPMLGTAYTAPYVAPKLDPRMMKKGGAVKSASARADGIAIRGKTRA